MHTHTIDYKRIFFCYVENFPRENNNWKILSFLFQRQSKVSLSSFSTFNCLWRWRWWFWKIIQYICLVINGRLSSGRLHFLRVPHTFLVKYCCDTTRLSYSRRKLALLLSSKQRIKWNVRRQNEERKKSCSAPHTHMVYPFSLSLSLSFYKIYDIFLKVHILFRGMLFWSACGILKIDPISHSWGREEMDKMYVKNVPNINYYKTDLRPF